MFRGRYAVLVVLGLVVLVASQVGHCASGNVKREYDRFYDKTKISVAIPVDNNSDRRVILYAEFEGQQRKDAIDEIQITFGPYAMNDGESNNNVRFLVDGERYDCKVYHEVGDFWTGFLAFDRIQIIALGKTSEYKIGRWEVLLDEQAKSLIFEFTRECEK